MRVVNIQFFLKSQLRRYGRAICALGLWILVAHPLPVSALTSEVRLISGCDPTFRDLVAVRLTKIVNSLDEQDWTALYDCCTAEGLASLRSLVETTNCCNVNPLYEPQLFELLNGNYEVREIKVKVEMCDTPGDAFQYLVFTVNPQGFICDARFAMEETIYEKIVKQGERLQDFAYRQPILHFLETFRTAHNNKDIDYISKVYSEDALIIVGRVLREKPDAPNYMERSTLSGEKIQLIRESKQDYIVRLRGVFARNDFVKVGFDSIDIKRCPENPHIYGIMLKQHWNSSTYSDVGYLFLMADFTEVSKPVIHVRSWQNDKFSDGSVVNLGDFIIVNGANE